MWEGKNYIKRFFNESQSFLLVYGMSVGVLLYSMRVLENIIALHTIGSDVWHSIMHVTKKHQGLQKARMGKSVRHPPETSWGDPGSTLASSASPVLA